MPASRSSSEKATRILGIDPGSRIAGYGLVDLIGNEIRFVDFGVFKLSVERDFSFRLSQLGEKLHSVLALHKPKIAAVERVFLGKNVDSAFKLGHARGVCLYQLANQGIEVVEYTPREVKKGITGNGNSTKEQVDLIISHCLNVRRDSGSKEDVKLSIDATDALALAYYHAIQIQLSRRFQGQPVRGRGKEFS